MNQEKKKLSVMRILKTILPMIYRSGPCFFWIFVIIALLHGLSWAAKVYFMQIFYDKASFVISTHGEISQIYKALLIYGIVVILAQVVNGLNSFVFMPFNQKSIGYMMQKVHLKVAKIGAVEYENSKTLDSINKSEQGINNAFNMVFSFIMSLTFFLPYVIFMGVWLFTIKPILAIVIVVSMLPFMLTKVFQATMYANLEDEVAPIRRTFDYYEQCICSKEYFKETRVLGVTKYFMNLYHDAMRLLNKKTLRVDKHACILDLGGKVIGLLGYLAILIIFVNSLLNGNITPGEFAAIFTAIAKMQEMVGGLIGTVGSIGQNSGSINNLLDFLEMPENDGEDTVETLTDGIELNHVSFVYPGMDHPAVQDLNLSIKKGETIAVVGQNGAGKSTLVRLITGLYQPSSGTVTISGKDTKTLNSHSMFRLMSGVFQKFQKYHMTLRENINISDIENIKEDEKLITTLHKADIDLKSESYVDGLDTMLSRDFNGVDLSGGQWQRVAIARGINRQSDIIVLDEPTAAIDPIEETKIYKKFSEISKNMTSILVTHRLGSARIADRIIVMENGKIVESGDHDSLMKDKKQYYEMFTAQAKWYEMQSN